MRALVLGASGFLGGHVYQNLLNNNLFKEILGTSHSSIRGDLHRININNEKEFEQYYQKNNPDFVIWALMSDENEQKLIHEGLRNLLNGINEQTKLIYVSTDGIFSEGEGYFDEESKPVYLDPKNPLSNYTNSKLHGEKLIQKEHKNHIIVRTGPLYGQDLQGNWDSRVHALQSNMTANITYKRADNITKTFVHVEDLANAIIELLTTDYTGILHVGPRAKESYYTFNLKMVNKLKLPNTFLIPDNLPIAEARKKGISLDTSLNTSKCNLLLETKFRDV